MLRVIALCFAEANSKKLPHRPCLLSNENEGKAMDDSDAKVAWAVRRSEIDSAMDEP